MYSLLNNVVNKLRLMTEEVLSLETMHMSVSTTVPEAVTAAEGVDSVTE
jgi:hypothetical protein